MGHMQLPKRLLAAVLAGALTFTQAAAFLDTSGHWAEDAISKWSEEYGIINGYDDGTFRLISLSPGERLPVFWIAF